MKTRENYFYKLVNYMKSVYNIEHGLNRLEDGRVNPIYKIFNEIFSRQGILKSIVKIRFWGML